VRFTRGVTENNLTVVAHDRHDRKRRHYDPSAAMKNEILSGVGYGGRIKEFRFLTASSNVVLVLSHVVLHRSSFLRLSLLFVDSSASPAGLGSLRLFLLRYLK
jgi:hypothetical protein